MVLKISRPAMMAIAAMASFVPAFDIRAATTAQWTSAISGNWTTAANWSTQPYYPNNGGPPGATYHAVLGATGAAHTVSLANNVTIDGLKFNSSDVTLDHVDRRFQAGSIQLDAGVYQMRGGTLASTTVIGNGGTFLPRYASTLDNVTLNNVSATLEELLFVNNGLALHNSTLTLPGAGNSSGTVIQMAGNQTISGNGTIAMQGTGQASGIMPTGPLGSTLTIGPGMTVRTVTAGGTVGASGYSLHNQGTLRVDGNYLTVAGNWTNSGAFEVNGGVLFLNGQTSTASLGTFVRGAAGDVYLQGTLDNTGSTFDVQQTGTMWLVGGTIRGGTITSSGPATLFVPSNTVNTATFEGVTLDLDLDAAFGAPISIRNGITLNHRTIRSRNANQILVYGNDPIGGTGEIVADQVPNSGNMSTTIRAPQSATDTLTIGPGVTVRSGATATNGSMRIVLGTGTTGGDGRIHNEGTISAQTAGIPITIGGTTVTNSGTVQALNGDTLTFITTPTNFAAGTLSGGTWKVFANSTLRVHGAVISTVAADVLVGGANSSFYGHATSNIDALAGLAAIAPAGAFRIESGRVFTTAGNLTNDGLLVVGASSVLTIPAGSVLTNHGTISGSGSINGTVVNGAAVSPGTSPGVLAIAGDLTQLSTASLMIELAGTTRALQYDHLSVSGSLALAGTLEVQTLGGFEPAIGDSFDILDFASRAGTFSEVHLPALSGGAQWDVSQLYTSGTIAVIVPEPTAPIAAAALAGAAATTVRQRRRRN